MAEMDRELLDVLPEGVFVEATLGQFDAQSQGCARLCAAGYVAALLRSNSLRFLQLWGMYLGLTAGTARTESEFDFDSGDELLMATDGLWDQPTDATGELQLREHLPEVLKDLSQNESVHDAVIAQLQQAIRKSGKQQDDICIVTVQRCGDAEVHHE
jgi:serine phosphatase RsbU (regulator of sigma subunit)